MHTCAVSRLLAAFGCAGQVGAGARYLSLERAEHDDAMRAGPRRIACDESHHRFAGALPWVARDRIEDRRVVWKYQLRGGDPVHIGGERGVDQDPVAWPEVVEVVEGVPGGYPMSCHREVADLPRQRRTWHVAGPKGQLGKVGPLHDGEPPPPAKLGDADEREGLAYNQLQPGSDRRGGTCPPFTLQLSGEGMLMLTCLQRSTPDQVHEEKHNDGPCGDTALTEDAKHGPHC